jgi:hypothetical protein
VSSLATPRGRGVKLRTGLTVTLDPSSFSSSLGYLADRTLRIHATPVRSCSRFTVDVLV